MTTKEEITTAIEVMKNVIKKELESFDLRTDIDYTEANHMQWLKENFPTIGCLCYMLKLAQDELKK